MDWAWDCVLRTRKLISTCILNRQQVRDASQWKSNAYQHSGQTSINGLNPNLKISENINLHESIGQLTHLFNRYTAVYPVAFESSYSYRHWFLLTLCCFAWNRRSGVWSRFCFTVQTCFHQQNQLGMRVSVYAATSNVKVTTRLYKKCHGQRSLLFIPGPWRTVSHIRHAIVCAITVI